MSLAPDIETPEDVLITGGFSCVECHHALSSLDGGFLCPGCRAEYRVDDGIPVFLSPQSAERAKIEDSRWSRHPVEGSDMPAASALEHKSEYLKLFEELVLKEHRFSGRVLEVGAGSCWASSLIKKANPQCRVYATDVSLQALRKGREVSRLLGVSIDMMVACDGQRLPFEDDYFSAVVGVAVIHHFEDAPKAMNEIRRVLRPGGFYVGIREGLAAGVFKPLYRYFGRGMEEEEEFGAVENVYTYGEWKALLKDFSYTISLKHSPKLGVAGKERLYYRFANALPDGLLRHMMATIKIYAVKPA